MPPRADAPLGERIDFLPLENLRLDPKNPRLPDRVRQQGQEAILFFIEANYRALVVGRSIALHRFFVSEPLIVIQGPGKKYTVVEGNRRLVALRLLTDPILRKKAKTREWDELAKTVQLPAQGIPVVIARNREEIAPIIGYRHIAGIQEWEPYPKARYIQELVDGPDKQSFTAVAELVGEGQAAVRRYYRNYSILEQARDQFKLDTSRLEENFGIFDRALTGGVRSFINAPIPSAVREREYPLPTDPETKRRVREVIRWIYGDAKSDPVISESRDLSDLSVVLQSQDGIDALRRSGNLAEAKEAARGGKARLIARLTEAQAALRAALQDIEAHADDQGVRALIAECREALADIEEMLNV